MRALENVLRKARDLGYEAPPGLEVTITHHERIPMGITYMWRDNGGEKFHIFLSRKDEPASGVRDRFDKPDERAEAIIAHELGHVLHAVASPTAYWTGKRGVPHTLAPAEAEKLIRALYLEKKPDLDIARHLSFYAGQSKIEFVAEAFAARIMGPQMKPKLTPEEWRAVSGEYWKYGGRVTPEFERQ